MKKAHLSTGIFWYWNADPTPGGIRQQLRTIRKAGFDCVYLHPMPDSFHKQNFFQGMTVSYLGEKYFRLAAVMLEECRRLGLRMMLYDEGGWPSGGVLDRLVRKYPEDRACYLVRNEAGTVRREYAAFPDLLTKRPTEHFIQMTHELYERHFGNEFGRTIQGIFTDEPFIRFSPGYNRVRTNRQITAMLKKKFGCDFERDILPHLWPGMGDSPEGNEARRKYLEVCTELFARNYSEVLGRWCAAHHLTLEGHLGGEDTFFLTGSEGNFLRELDGFQVPGIDTIWQQIYPEDRPGFFARFASASAIRNHRTQALCECFNVYTYSLKPSVMSWIANDLLVKGINRILPMPYLYSDRGKRKICCSTDFSPRNPVWKAFPALNGFWRRAGNFNAGALQPRVWLLARTEYFRSEWGEGISPEQTAADARAQDFCRKLDDAGVFYRFADERDLAGSERPDLLIVPSAKPVPGLKNFPRVEYGIPKDIASFSCVKLTRASGCRILPVIRPEGEALMIFNPTGEETVFSFETGDRYAELPLPDNGYSLLHPVRSEGRIVSLTVPPWGLRILLKNGAEPAGIPAVTRGGKVQVQWRIREIERLHMSLRGRTYFSREKCDLPLPDNGLYTGLEKDFSGHVTLETVLDSPEAGDALLEFDRIEQFAELKVNGRTAGLRPAAPWLFRTRLKKGTNRLQLIVSTSGGNEFRRCFREELQPAGWFNNYSKRFTLYPVDDAKCGAGSRITVWKVGFAGGKSGK